MKSLRDRFQKYLLRDKTLGFAVAIRRRRFGDDFLGARRKPFFMHSIPWRQTIFACASNPAGPPAPIPSC